MTIASQWHQPWSLSQTSLSHNSNIPLLPILTFRWTWPINECTEKLLESQHPTMFSHFKRSQKDFFLRNCGCNFHSGTSVAGLSPQFILRQSWKRISMSGTFLNALCTDFSKIVVYWISSILVCPCSSKQTKQSYFNAQSKIQVVVTAKNKSSDYKRSRRRFPLTEVVLEIHNHMFACFQDGFKFFSECLILTMFIINDD